MRTVSLWLIVGLFFVTPFSRSGTAALTVLIVVLFCLSAGWQDSFRRIANNPVSLPIAGILCFLVAGYAYSVGSTNDISSHLLSYSRLLVVFILIASLSEDKWRSRCMYAFCAGCIFLVASSYISIFYQVPWDKNPKTGLGADHTVFVNYLWQNVLLSFFSCVCFFFAKQTSGKKYVWWLTLLAACLFAIFFLARGRTGQITLTAALFCMLLIFYRGTRLTIALTIAVTVIGASLFYSSQVQSSFRLAINETETYLKTHAHNNSSIGLRLHNWRTNVNLIAEHPLIGHGSASYRVISEQVFKNAATCGGNCLHSHNQFLFFMVENGVLPAVLYFWLLLTIFKLGLKCPRTQLSFLLTPFAVILFLHSMVDSPLVVSMDRSFYVAMLGLLASGLISEQSDQKR